MHRCVLPGSFRRPQTTPHELRIDTKLSCHVSVVARLATRPHKTAPKTHPASNVTTLTYSPDGAWLFAGTESGDVVTVNAPRHAVQLLHPVAAAGVGWGGLVPGAGGGLPLVGAADGTLSAFDFEKPVHSAPPLAALPGAITGVSAAAGGGGGGGVRLLVGTAQGGIYQ